MATKTVQNYTGTRVTFHSTKPFDSIMTKLYASIGPVENASAVPTIVKAVLTSPDSNKKEKYIALTEKQVGPHGFMIFQASKTLMKMLEQEFDHGVWVPLFSVGSGLKCKRIILGNPLIAITMLKHDMTAGLAVPVELLVLERREGVDLIYQLPSALIAGLNRDEELVKAVGILDGKLEKLVEHVAS